MSRWTPPPALAPLSVPVINMSYAVARPSMVGLTGRRPSRCAAPRQPCRGLVYSARPVHGRATPPRKSCHKPALRRSPAVIGPSQRSHALVQPLIGSGSRISERADRDATPVWSCILLIALSRLFEPRIFVGTRFPRPCAVHDSAHRCMTHSFDRNQRTTSHHRHESRRAARTHVGLDHPDEQRRAGGRYVGQIGDAFEAPAPARQPREMNRKVL
jgi:hypothetical protein